MHDALYVRARAALLDATEALGPHLDAVVLVGAQAVYLHTGDADLAVAEYTTDADFAISPIQLAATPLLNHLLKDAGFTPREHPGGWLSREGVYVDLMVPEALAGPGTRGTSRTARQARRAPGQGSRRKPRRSGQAHDQRAGPRRQPRGIHVGRGAGCPVGEDISVDRS